MQNKPNLGKSTKWIQDFEKETRIYEKISGVTIDPGYYAWVISFIKEVLK